MNKDEKGFHLMARSVLGTRVTNSTVSGAPPALVRAFDLLTAQEARLNASRRREGEALDGLAEQKNSLQRVAILAILPIAGMVQALASENKDLALRGQVDFSYSDLEGLPDLDCANKCAELFTTAAGRQVLLTSDFGLTPQMMEDADDLIGEFSILVGSPREGIKRRKNAGIEIEENIPEMREVLANRLDPLMRQFNDPGDTDLARTRRAFYTDYQNARMIIDLPGADVTAPATTPPANP